MEKFIYMLLVMFREYERYYTADNRDPLEWRKEFLEFVLWWVDKIHKEAQP